MNPIDHLLARLDGVRSTGARRWLAKCPAHDDRSPSLSISERDDGAVLLHDHGGCSVHEVLSAVCMEMHELFPKTDRDRDGRPRQRNPIPFKDILETLATEALIVIVAANDTARGEVLGEVDRERLMQAAARFWNAHDLVSDHKMTQAEKHQLLRRAA